MTEYYTSAPRLSSEFFTQCGTVNGEDLPDLDDKRCRYVIYRSRYPLMVLRSKSGTDLAVVTFKYDTYTASSHIPRPVNLSGKIPTDTESNRERFQVLFDVNDKPIAIGITNLCDRMIKLDFSRKDVKINETDPPNNLNRVNELTAYQTYSIRADQTNGSRQIIVSKKTSSTHTKGITLKEEESRPKEEKFGDYLYLHAFCSYGSGLEPLFAEAQWRVTNFVSIRQTPRTRPNVTNYDGTLRSTESYRPRRAFSKGLPRGILPAVVNMPMAVPFSYSANNEQAQMVPKSLGKHHRPMAKKTRSSRFGKHSMSSLRSKSRPKPAPIIEDEPEGDDIYLEAMFGDCGGDGACDDDYTPTPVATTLSVPQEPEKTVDESEEEEIHIKFDVMDGACDDDFGSVEECYTGGSELLLSASPEQKAKIESSESSDSDYSVSSDSDEDEEAPVQPELDTGTTDRSFVGAIKGGDYVRVNGMDTGVGYNYNLNTQIAVIGFSIVENGDFDFTAAADVVEYSFYKDNVLGKELMSRTVYDQDMCSVCMASRPKNVMYPCGHKCLCNLCCSEFKRSEKTSKGKLECMLCKTPVMFTFVN